jgi:hypothetical protein
MNTMRPQFFRDVMPAHADPAEHVDFEEAAPIVVRNFLKRLGLEDAEIVHLSRSPGRAALMPSVNLRPNIVLSRFYEIYREWRRERTRLAFASRFDTIYRWIECKKLPSH